MRLLPTRALAAVSLAVLGALAPSASSAWGASGHHLISRAAADAFPMTLPAFLRTTEAAGEIEALGTEADRDKQIGDGFDKDLDPGHYLDLGDDGKIAGVVDVNALPESRLDYDTKLRTANETQYSQGFLPYTLLDGAKLVELDFAIWRTDRAGASSAATVGDRLAFATDMRRREADTIRDIGYWSHFVGDASQPLHVSIHYNGWGPGPNPGGYTQAHVHSHFEGEYVRENVTLAAVEAAMAPVHDCACPIGRHVASYLTATNAQVVPFYTLEKQGAFASKTDAGVAFTVARLADGANALRDFVTEAYTASASMSVGYPDAHTVDDYEGGRAVPSRSAILGSD